MRNELTIIKNSDQYDQYMAELVKLLDSGLNENSKEFERFELLSLIIEHYESQHYVIEKPDPIDAIKFRMDQENLTQSDMKQYIGSLSKVSEVLNRKRPLSLSMIRRIHEGLGIPADILIQDVSNIEWSIAANLETELELTINAYESLIIPFDGFEEPLPVKSQVTSAVSTLIKEENAPKGRDKNPSVFNRIMKFVNIPLHDHDDFSFSQNADTINRRVCI